MSEALIQILHSGRCVRGCDPPEAFILHREIVLTMKADLTLRAYLMIGITNIAR